MRVAVSKYASSRSIFTPTGDETRDLSRIEAQKFKVFPPPFIHADVESTTGPLFLMTALLAARGLFQEAGRVKAARPCHLTPPYSVYGVTPYPQQRAATVRKVHPMKNKGAQLSL